jgi:hypothetical protein
MGSPPVEGEWDAGTGGVDHPEYPEELIMGDIALPPDQPLMGKIAPRDETE